ncbi:MAG: CBS domain-containing protein [Hyphomonadaceae bacterium]|nr:CBS domain-containing protein [Hyphomonadaceae bacterium]
MMIAQILSTKGAAVYAVSGATSLQDAARELTEKKVGCVLVLDADGAIQGILSERDIVRVVAQRGAAALDDAVDSAMSRAVITISAEETVDDGLARMTDRRLRHLPVMREGALIGLVSIGDLVKRKIEEVEVEAASLRAYIASG